MKKMNYEFLLKYISQENLNLIISFIDKYGIIAGICLPIIESFFPFIPLVIFVTINILIFGFFRGYLYSYLGNIIGSLLLFLLIRFIRKKKFSKSVEKDTKFYNIQRKLKENDFSFLFILFCFPFTPSFLVTGIAAISNFKFNHFLISLVLGKLVMIFSLSYIGYNIASFFETPGKSILLIIIIIAVNFIGKYFLRKYSEKN